MVLKYTALGSAIEVGRSCHIIQVEKLMIMFDCGIKPGNGNDQLPLFEEFFALKLENKNYESSEDKKMRDVDGKQKNLTNEKKDFIFLDFSSLDLILLSHFHLDHAALLPFITSKSTYNKYKVLVPFTGKILMTKPTKSILPIQLTEFMKFTPIYDNFYQMMRQIETVEFNTTIQHQFFDKNVEITTSKAGHVIGAAIFHLLITNNEPLNSDQIGKNPKDCKFNTLKTYTVVYTGDFLCEGELHLPGICDYFSANKKLLKDSIKINGKEDFGDEKIRKDLINSISSTADDYYRKVHNVDLLITESTFAIVNRQPRIFKTSKLISLLISSIEAKGIVLIPCYALGRLHEIKMIIETYLPEKYKIQCEFFFASNVMENGLKLYERHSDYLKEGVSEKMLNLSPFKPEYIQKHVFYKKKNTSQQELKTLIIFSSPTLLTKGTTSKIFQLIRNDEENLVILPGNCCSEIEQGTSTESSQIKAKCRIETIGFSAHSDSNTMIRFLKNVNPKNIVLTHGHKEKMKRFKKILHKEFNGEKKQIYDLKEKDLKEVEKNVEEDDQKSIKRHKKNDSLHILKNEQIESASQINIPPVPVKKQLFLDPKLLQKIQKENSLKDLQNISDIKSSESNTKIHVPTLGQTLKIPSKKYLFLYSKHEIKPGSIVCKFKRVGNKIFVDKINKKET